MSGDTNVVGSISGNVVLRQQKLIHIFVIFWAKHDNCIIQKYVRVCAWLVAKAKSVIGSPLDSIWGPSDWEPIVTTELYCIFWRTSHFDHYSWTWVIYMNNVLSIKTILFDILRSKRRMFVSFMKILACWLLHRLIKFNKICWEKRPAKPRPNLRTSFCRRDLKNTQPHLKD